jgi:hypothetical protein
MGLASIMEATDEAWLLTEWIPIHMPRIPLAALIVSVSVAVLLFGCGIYALMGDGQSSGAAWGTKLGVSRRDSGRLVLHVLTCPGEQVREVKLAGSDLNFSTTGPALWEIRSIASSSTEEFVVGSAPAGFTTVTALAGIPGASQPLIFDVTTSGGTFGTDFIYRDARPGTVYVDGPGLLGEHVNVSPAKFGSVRGQVCRLQRNGPGG